MISKIYKELFIVILVFVVGWGTFTLLKLEPAAPEFEVSIEKEEQLAELLIENYLNSANVLHSDTLDSAIYVITQRLLNGIDESDYNYTFYVVEDEQVNAFATLGGNVFINSGLIKFSENPEELAAVLAHEIGHVEKRHVVNKLVKELGVTILFSVLSGSDPVLISEIVKHSISTIFDRTQESEADDFGLELMEEVNLSPRSLGKIFRRINEKYGGYNENLEFLMTHPHTSKRIKKSLEYILKNEFEYRPFTLDWKGVKNSL